MYEKIFNLFVFVEGDIIYELGVTIHEKDGSDEDKMSFLRQQVNSDFKKAIRFLVPNRYLLEDSSSSQTITAIKYEKFRTLMQMNLHLQVFEEIFQSFNASETPLFCLTPIVNGEPKVDKIENFQSIKKHNSEEAKSMEFRFVDYLVDYSSKDGFDMTRLLDDDYLLAIKLLYNEGHYISAVKLFLSFIDTIAYLEFGDISNNFHKWLDQYAELSNIGISSSELWEMRNSLLHMTNSDSRKILKGEVQRLMFYVGTLTHEFPDKTDEAKYVKLIDLINAVLVGVEKWAMSYNIDRSKLADFISRYDRVISDSRYETVRIN